MKGLSIRPLVFSILLIIQTPASAVLLFSTNPTDWQTDMQTLFSNQLNQQLFRTNYTNISAVASNTFSALPDRSAANYESIRMDWQFDGNNVDLGSVATFNSEKTGIDWSFTLTALETDTVTSSSSHYHGTRYESGDETQATVIFNDRVDRSNFDHVDAFTNTLSIGKHKGYDTNEIADGDPYNWDNDDFRVDITSGPALYAFAFELVNNKKYIDANINPDNPSSSDGGLYSYGRESLTITDTSGNEHVIGESTGGQPVIPGYHDDPATPEDEGRYTDNFDDIRFIGIVSDMPIAIIMFNEDSRSDDIGLRDFRFAGVAPVPIPAGFWLLLSGIAVLFRSRETKYTSVAKCRQTCSGIG